MSENIKNQVLLKSGFFENSVIKKFFELSITNVYLLIYLQMLQDNIFKFKINDLDNYLSGMYHRNFINKLLDNDLAKQNGDVYELIVDKNILEVKKDDTDSFSKKRKEIVNYLNQKLNKHYRPNSTNIQKHINARLNEGYTFDDFKIVIDKKYNDWMGTEYEKYLRPETLFGSKFDSYLNQSGGRSFNPGLNNPFYEELMKSGDTF